jgi:hypothetical protein
MRKTHTFEKSANIFEIRQLLSTFYKEFFQSRQIFNEINQKESFILVSKRMSNEI